MTYSSCDVSDSKWKSCPLLYGKQASLCTEGEKKLQLELGMVSNQPPVDCRPTFMLKEGLFYGIQNRPYQNKDILALKWLYGPPPHHHAAKLAIIQQWYS